MGTRMLRLEGRNNQELLLVLADFGPGMSEPLHLLRVELFGLGSSLMNPPPSIRGEEFMTPMASR